MKWQVRCPKCEGGNFRIVAVSEDIKDVPQLQPVRVLCAVCHQDIGAVTLDVE